MKAKMIVRLVPKKETQAMIRALRDAGLKVEKDNGGMYSCDFTLATKPGDTGEPKTRRLFTAMPGSRGYLVRMQQDLFANAEAL